MKIYFNWLGNWIEINDNQDYIDDMKPSDFIAAKIRMYVSLDSLENMAPKYIKITKDSYDYYIQFSQLVWLEKRSNFTNEERW